ncbi:MAG: DoxX family protein [Euryarchaeota archaeon]|nr:DoxX family protein [Euryarchaeota archaeon]
MLEPLRQRARSESTEPDSSERPPSRPTARTTAFRLGRLLYGGLLAQMALDGLMNLDERAQYAEAKGVPLPELATKGSHWLLLFGGVGITLWRVPKLAAVSVVTFFLGVTPMMHDFWAVDEEQKQQETINFVKNSALLGTALLVFGVAQSEEESTFK